MRVAPQSSHCSTWPPSAAVRQAVMALRMRRSTHPRCPACACRNAAPWRRKISATSRAGAMRPAQPGGTTSKRSRSSGLGVLLIVLVATRVYRAASPSAAAPTAALSVPATGEEAPAAALVFEPSAEQSAQKQRGRPFEPGQSGNPNGRPKGARNLVTRAVEALIDGQGEALAAKAVEKAHQGDSA